ncbi:MAG: MMPL family transporter, partial [Bauldia litoralis]
DYGSLKPAQEAMAAVRRIATEKGLVPENGVRVRMTGSVAINNEELDSVARGASVAGIVSLVLVTLLLFAGLRSRWLVGGVLLTLVMGLVLTAGFAALAFGSLNLISVAFAVPFIGLAVDFGIHFCLRFEEAAQADQPPRAALRSAARSVGRALALSAAAAAAAFFAFVPTDYRGVAELGMLAGVGVIIAFSLSLTFLPALLALRPRWRRRVPSPAAGFVVARLVRFEKGIKRHGKAITIGAVVAGFAAFAIAPAARFDHNPMNLKDPGTESIATAIDLRRDATLGADAIQILVTDKAAADALVPRLEKLATVGSVRTLASFVPGGQTAKLAVIDDLALLLGPVLAVDKPRPPPTAGERRAALRALEARTKAALASGKAGDMAPLLERLGAALRKIDAAPDADATLSRLDRDLIGTLPRQLKALSESLKAKRVTLQSVPESLRSRYVSPTGVRRIEVIPKGTIENSEALRRFVDEVAAVAPGATGSPVFELRAGDAIVDAYLEATLIAFVLISLMVFAVLRRLLTTVLVLTPVFLAGAFTLAVCALFGPELNFANIIVLPLLIGLGAAGGIHIVRRADRGGGAELVHTSTPRAVLFSALTTLASFGALALSSHRGTASMGELLFIAIFFTLVCSLFFLPAMIAYLLDRETLSAREPHP